MKKILSVLLAVILIVSSIFTALLTPVAAVTNDFEDPSKWVIYASGSKYVNETNGTLAASWAKITQNTNMAYITEGDRSLKLSTRFQIPTYKFAVEKNTDYTLSFKYFSTEATCPVNYASIRNNDYMGGRNSTNGQTDYVRMDAYGSFSSPDGLWANAVHNWDINIKTGYMASAWNEISLSFNSGDNESLTFVFSADVNGVYLDAFSLSGGEEPTPTPNPEPTPDLDQPENNFEDASNWVVYTDKSKYVNSTNGTLSSWGKVTENTNASFITEGEKSIEFFSKWQKASFVMNLNKNTKYTLSYKYYYDGETSPLYTVGVLNSDFLATGRYNSGATTEENRAYYSYIDQNGAYTADNAIYANATLNWNTKTKTPYTKGGWNTVSISFNSGDNENLSLVIVFDQANIYVDDFSLVGTPTTTPEPEPEPDTPSQPSSTDSEFETASDWVIYASNSTYFNETNGKKASSAFKVEENTDSAYIDSGSKSLIVKANWQKPTYKFNIDKNTKYTLTFKYYSTEAACPLSSAGVINNDYSFSGNSVSPTSATAYYYYIDKYSAYSSTDGVAANVTHDWDTKTVSNYTPNAWNEITLTFESGNNESLTLVLSFEVNGIYVDSFKLTSNGTTTPNPDPTPDPDPDTPPQPGGTDSVFETASDWVIYASSSTYFNETNGKKASSAFKVEENTNLTYVNSGSKSLVVNASWQKPTYKLSVEKNKDYVLSFKYYSAANTCPLSSAGVINNDYSFSGNSVTLKSETAYYYYIDKYSAYSSTDGIAANVKHDWETKTVNNYKANEWNDVTLAFNSGDNEFLTLVVSFESAGIYLDSFELKEGKPVIPKTEKDNWQIIINLENTPVIDGTATPGSDWPGFVNSTVEKYKYNGQPSVKYRANNKTMVRPLGDLEVGKTYKISLAYCVPESSILVDDKVFGSVGVVNHGTKIYTTGGGNLYPVGALLYTKSPICTEKEVWKEFSFEFTNFDSDPKYFFATTPFSGGYTLYLSAFAVEEVETDQTVAPYFDTWGDEPLGDYLIDFDSKTYSFPENTIEVVKGPERDSESTNTLHVIGGEYASGVFPKFHPVRQGIDPLFTLKVKPNTLYEYSFWIYIDEDATYVPWLQFYYDYAANGYILLTKTKDIGKWMHYTVKFTTKADQYATTLAFNASEKPYDMWIDDFRVKEILPGTIGSLENAGYSEDMHNVLIKQNFFNKIKEGKSASYKVSVTPSTQYTFGINIESLKKSDSRIFLSYNGVDPIAPSEEGAPVAQFKSNGQNGRYSFDFVSDSTGIVYVVIENNDGALKFNEPALFKYATLSMGRYAGKNEPVDRELSMNKDNEPLKKLSTTGIDNEDFVNTESDDSAENPKTGSSATPFVILILTFALASALLALTKKGGAESK